MAFPRHLELNIGGAVPTGATGKVTRQKAGWSVSVRTGPYAGPLFYRAAQA